MVIKHNIDKFRSELSPLNVKLIAVSKAQPIEKIQEAYSAGQRIFGENKVQEMIEKQPRLPLDIEWHLIGHLQRNKVKYIAPFVSLIHSVDSMRLLQEINKEGQKLSRVIHCLLQVFIAREETKFGLDVQELHQLLQSAEIASYRFVAVDGLMGIATLSDSQDQIRYEFRSLKKTFDDLKRTSSPSNIQMKDLSMGMSSDYKIALEQGSTMVRIGTAIFGARRV